MPNRDSLATMEKDKRAVNFLRFCLEGSNGFLVFEFKSTVICE